ncbi:MAG: hypothetical protein AAF235_04655, partial [Planctomycetota bacterium]
MADRGDSFDLTGNTADGSLATDATICFYSTDSNDADLSDDTFVGFFSDLGEVVYTFTTVNETTVDLALNLPAASRTNLDYYLVRASGGVLDAEAMQPVFVEGSATLSTVAFNTVGYLDDDGSFGAVLPGTYYFVVDAFSDPFGSLGGGDGVFDVTLSFGDNSTQECGLAMADPAGDALVDFDATAGGTESFNAMSDPIELNGIDNSDGASHFCFYTGSGPAFIPANLGLTVPSGEDYIVKLEIDADTGSVLLGAEVIFEDEPNDAELVELYLVEGIDVGDFLPRDAMNGDGTGPDPLVDIFGDGSLLAAVNQTTIGFTDLNGDGPQPVGQFNLSNGELVPTPLTSGTYFLIVDAIDGGTLPEIGVELTFGEGPEVLSPDFDPSTDATDLGALALADEPFDISTCDSTGDLELAIFDDAGELVMIERDGLMVAAIDNDGCGTANGPAALEQISLPAGTYHLAVAAFDADFRNGFIADTTFSSGTMSGDLDIGSAMDEPLAGTRAIFTFEVTEPAAGCNRADLAEPFGVLNASDISGFVTAFLAGTADLNGDMATNASDISAFVTDFLAGCSG